MITQLLVSGTRHGRRDVEHLLSCWLGRNGWGATKGFQDLVLVQGGARGVDGQAAAWANERGIFVRTFVADWNRHGKAAGPKRNQAMVDSAVPGHDYLLAFPDESSIGTHDCVRRARAHGLLVEVL